MSEISIYSNSRMMDYALPRSQISLFYLHLHPPLIPPVYSVTHWKVTENFVLRTNTWQFGLSSLVRVIYNRCTGYHTTTSGKK
jgi:hypothetical protein